MLIVIENGKLIQIQNPGYFSSLTRDWSEQAKFDSIEVPLAFDLKNNNGEILKRGDYRGTGDIVSRGKRKFVILGDTRKSYPEEYEIGDVTKESDDFYTGVLWGVYNAFAARRNYISLRVQEPRDRLPISESARAGVEYGKSEFKRLFKRKKK